MRLTGCQINTGDKVRVCLFETERHQLSYSLLESKSSLNSLKASPSHLPISLHEEIARQDKKKKKTLKAPADMLAKVLLLAPGLLFEPLPHFSMLSSTNT